MNRQEIYDKIKSTVHSFLPDAKVILFGSRAKDVAHKDSDYDLLIVTGNEFTSKEKMKYESNIDKALVWAIDAPFDVILKSVQEIERYKHSKGHIIYYALNDAVEI